MFRKIVSILGILCLVLVLGAGGTAGYLAAKGTLTKDSLKTAVAVVTSQPAASDPQPAASQPESHAAAGHMADAGAPGGDAEEPEAAAAGRIEMMRRQLANEQALLEAGRLNLQREQEQFEQSRKQWDASRQKELASSQLSGVQKELDYLSSIKPAQALALLRAKSDDQASRILMAMETRKGKKIIEMCKSSDDKEWVKRILELIRQQSNVQAQALTGG